MARQRLACGRATYRRWLAAALLGAVLAPAALGRNFEFPVPPSYLIEAPQIRLTAQVHGIPPYVVGDTLPPFVRLELWAFPTPSTGSLAGGVKVAQYFVGHMCSSCNIPVNQLVAFTQPADGTWYLTMFITETEEGVTTPNGGYLPRAYYNFPVAETFGTPLPPDQALAVEYLHAGFGHYFVSADSDEVAGLDTGVFGGWARTGQTFKVWKTGAGLADLCRFFTVFFAPKSSHFYTAIASECESVKQNPIWEYEKLAAKVALPVNGVCAVGSIPLYRVYNDGQSGAPNHRYTTSITLRDAMVAQGFIAEESNTVCVPQ
jgi:hypothetical protein